MVKGILDDVSQISPRNTGEKCPITLTPNFLIGVLSCQLVYRVFHYNETANNSKTVALEWVIPNAKSL